MSARLQDADRVLRYEYRCENASLVTPIFRRWISEPLARHFPLWLAPNLVTIAANVAVAASCLFVLVFAESELTSTLWLLLPAIGIVVYAALDNADGLHAQRTGSSGPLGDFLDHWLDGIAAFLIPIALTRLVGLNLYWQSALVTGAMLAFWATAWDRWHTGCMRLPLLGDVEANLAATAFLTCCALFGLSFWQYSIYGLTIAEWFGLSALSGTIAAVAGALRRDVRRWQVLGVGLNIGLIWIWMIHELLTTEGPSNWRTLAPFLIGLVGLKHVGDLMRSHLIGAKYSASDLVLTISGVALCASTFTARGPYSWFIRDLALCCAIVTMVSKLIGQFVATTAFICKKLDVRILTLPADQDTTDHQAIVPINSRRWEGERGEDFALHQVSGEVPTYRVIHISLPIVIVCALEIAVWLWGRVQFEHQRYQAWTEALWSIGVSISAIVVVFQIPNLLFRSRLRLRQVSNILLTVLFLILQGAHLFLEHPLDFYFVGDNHAEMFYPPSIAMATQSISLEQALLGINAVLGVALLAIATSSFKAWPKPRYRQQCLALHLLLLAILLASPLSRHNELTYFARTAFDYSVGRYSYPNLPTVEKYPYVQIAKHNEARDQAKPRPHVFLIMMESFNANFVEKSTPDGREYTPVFNSKIEEGVFVDRFYGNSVQTARAYPPTLCSVLPSYWGKESTSFPDLRVHSLAHILRMQGYRTYFFQSQQQLAFDRIGDYMVHLGFDEVHGMDGSFVEPDESKYVWGWGLQDNKTFEKVFRFLDKSVEDSESPLFVTVMTTSHHYPFKEMPADQRYLYPTPTDRKQWFANSIHLSDKYLGTFFSELAARPRYRNSLIVITGDHSFPAGEHGNYFNEYRFYEENFRIPLLIWSPSRLVPQRITNSAYSQIDIPPTILDLLDVNTPNHFQGRSIIGKDNAPKPVAMIQPYDGTRLCIVEFPFKYVQSLRVPGEYKYQGSEMLEKFRREVARIHLNQKLLEDNRIWPQSLDESVR